MMYFSKIGNIIINLENVATITKKESKYTLDDGRDPIYVISFMTGSNMIIDQNQYDQIINDIDQACTLYKLQSRGYHDNNDKNIS